MGRQSIYSHEVADAICARLAGGESLKSICRDEGMPAASTVLAWVEDESKGFADQYTQARARGYQLLADEILEIADEEVTMVRRSKHQPSADDDAGDVEVVFDPTAVARNRLRVDSRKWMLSKMLPKVYGDKVTSELTGPNGGPVQFATIAIELVKPQATG